MLQDGWLVGRSVGPAFCKANGTSQDEAGYENS